MLTLLTLVACTTWLEPAPTADPHAREGERAGVEILFCPDDDVVAAELAEIARVRDGRLADPDAAADYSIRYAVYNLRNPLIVDALADAWHAGVDVQILIEKDQLSDSLDYNTADEVLEAEGFEVVVNHRDLPPEERHRPQLVGISGSGLMHLKTRLVHTPDAEVLVTGSHNPGDNATFNDETWHRITRPELIAAYGAAYEAVLMDTDLVNTWDADTDAQALFTPEDDGPAASDHMFDWLAEEDEQILLAVYSLRDVTAPSHERSLVELLGDKVAEGVPVIVLTDRKQSDAWGDPTEDRLRDVGVHVIEATNATTPYTAMHAKLAILGRTDIRVISDAANWSASGLGTSTKKATNVESVLFFEAGFEEGRVGRRALSQWTRWLRRYAHLSAADGEPSADVLLADLMGRPGWPTQTVSIAATAETSWGETLHVVGDHEALGQWGSLGEGVALDPASYPVWTGSVELPLGAEVAWKLVAVGEGWRWEGGDNRVSEAHPGVDDAVHLEANWR